jgi:adenosylmethionine-8-amino-7-oxononanoate aminotransferase
MEYEMALMYWGIECQKGKIVMHQGYFGDGLTALSPQARGFFRIIRISGRNLFTD